MRCSLLFLAVAAFGQGIPANITNAKVEIRSYAGDLDAVIRADQPTWFAYSIQSVNKNNEGCCWDGARGCDLEEGKRGVSNSGAVTTPIPLEGSSQSTVLIRTEAKNISKVRLFSTSCPLDAGGLPVVWLNGVPAGASVSYLLRIATATPEKFADGAIFAIAQHNTTEADAALDKLTQAQQPERVREKASFWMGTSRGAAGVVSLNRILHSDLSDKVREKAVFALSVSHQPEAVNYMIEAAKSDASAHVRSQALFWLAHKAGKRSSDAIANAIENDPDTGVKKQAVFALSQLPSDEGIPKLIQVASTQRNPEVRKQAFFWLGQSHDPRALRFFEQVLAAR